MCRVQYMYGAWGHAWLLIQQAVGSRAGSGRPPTLHGTYVHIHPQHDPPTTVNTHVTITTPPWWVRMCMCMMPPLVQSPAQAGQHHLAGPISCSGAHQQCRGLASSPPWLSECGGGVLGDACLRSHHSGVGRNAVKVRLDCGVGG